MSDPSNQQTEKSFHFLEFNFDVPQTIISYFFDSQQVGALMKQVPTYSTYWCPLSG